MIMFGVLLSVVGVLVLAPMVFDIWYMKQNDFM